MLAIVKENDFKAFSFMEVPMPTVSDEEILIKVKCTGICGTDLPIFEGIRKVPVPFIPGHEFSGTVEKIGKKVIDFKVGDRVSGSIVVSCGECHYCKNGLETLCCNIVETGIHVNGSFAQYLKIPSKVAHKLTDQITYEQAACVDPLASAYRMINKALIKSSDTVVVFGCGPIGLFAVQLLKLKKVKKIILVGSENDEFKLEIGKKLGADNSISVNIENHVERIMEYNDGLLADKVIEAVGKESVVDMCLDALKKNGLLSTGGIFNDSVKLNFGKIVRNELTVTGSICYTTSEFKECLRLLEKGLINTDLIITHKFKLNEMASALKVIKDKKALKVLLYP
jgi:2-desacetyl-2-hydroxyethyl bacteriochlorophyllide A dehydrogenase